MAGALFIDATALISLAKAGLASKAGSAYLDSILGESGASLQITDVVYNEVTKNPIYGDSGLLKTWLNSNIADGNITYNTTSTGAALDAGASIPDAGEVSIEQAIEANFGGDASILSNDTSYDWSVGDRLSMSDFMNQNLDSGTLSPEDYAATRDSLGDAGRVTPADSFQTNADLGVDVATSSDGALTYYAAGDPAPAGFVPIDPLNSSSTSGLPNSGTDSPASQGGTSEPSTDSAPVSEGGAAASYSYAAGVIEGAGEILGSIGETLLWFTIANSTMEAFNQVSNGDYSGAGDTMASLTGAVETGLDGAEAGGEVGAAVGSVFGPVGTAAGGLIGGIIGGIAGYEAGQASASAIWNALGAALNALPGLWGGHASSGGKTPSPGVPGSPASPKDPLVLDLAGSGIKLSSVTGSVVDFDFTGSGFATQTGWIESGEGLLVMLNGGQTSGTLTASQLLGAASGSGFTDLAALDANGDGVINASDPAFAQLGVFVPTSGTQGQFYTLAQLGITSISLATTASGEIFNGNTTVSTSSFTITNAGVATQHTIAEVDLATDAELSVYTPPAGFSYSPAALLLPDIDGFGLMPNLRVAMSLDPTLLAQVQSLVTNAGTMDWSDFNAAFEAMVSEWIGAENVDPTSTGQYINAQHLALVYAFYGIDPALQPEYQAEPNWHNGPLNEGIYQLLIASMETRFISQVAGSQLLNGVDPASVIANPYLAFAQIQYDPATNNLTVNLGELLQSLQSNAPSDPSAASSYWSLVLPVVADLRVDLFGGDISQFAAQFVMQAEQNGLAMQTQQSLLSQLSMSAIDETAASGALGWLSSGGVIYLGAGVTSVSGSSDTYVYEGGDLTVADSGSSSYLVMNGVSSSAVVFERPNGGADLVINNPASGESVTVSGYFSGDMNVIFGGDGATITAAEIPNLLRTEAAAYLIDTADQGTPLAQEQAQLALYGYPSTISGGDVAGALSGDGSSDAILFGSADQTASGGGGSDLYVYSSADGSDVIDDGGSPLAEILVQYAGDQAAAANGNGRAPTAHTRRAA